MRKIKLGSTYITTFGREFTPVEKVTSPLKKQTIGNIHADYSQREESRFLDKDGNRIRKSKLSHIKGEEPPKRPKSTI